MKGLTLRKAGAVALAGAMTLSCASCMLFGPNKKEIVEAADNFAGTLLKCDAGKVVKLTNEKKNSDAAAALELLFDESRMIILISMKSSICSKTAKIQRK